MNIRVGEQVGNTALYAIRARGCMVPGPKLFVGSSSEAKPQATTFADALSDVAQVVPWWEAPHFAPMKGTLEALIAAAQEFDFGLFILTPDDSIVSRGERSHAARDNVLFELGLFLGELGRDRTFALVQEHTSRKVKMPTDLLGITIPRFAGPRTKRFQRSVRDARREIATIVDREGFRKLGFTLVKAWSYDEERGTLRFVLSELLVHKHFHRLRDRSLVLVARRRNYARNPEDDTSVTVGAVRKVPKTPQPMVLETACFELLELEGEEVVEGYLMLLPPGSTTHKFKTIAEVLEEGGRVIEVRGRGIAKQGEE